jgi:hypothetical protein
MAPSSERQSPLCGFKNALRDKLIELKGLGTRRLNALARSVLAPCTMRSDHPDTIQLDGKWMGSNECECASTSRKIR